MGCCCSDEEDDRANLLWLFEGVQNLPESWSMQTPLEDFEGVRTKMCQRFDNEKGEIARVTHLDLSNRNLSNCGAAEGPMRFTRTRALTYLYSLDLSGNRGLCCRSPLDLSDPALPVGLTKLNLSGTGFGGPIFREGVLGNWLREVRLANCHFSGTLDLRDLGRCNKALTLLAVEGNAFDKIIGMDKVLEFERLTFTCDEKFKFL